MKTKEEILKSKLPQQFQCGWFGVNPPIEWEKAIEAMEEYAQYKVNELNESDVIKSVCPDCGGKNFNVFENVKSCNNEKCNWYGKSGETVL